MGINQLAIMNNATFEELLALRHKRPLTPAEQTRLQAWLARHPADRVRWTEESALSTALHRLPNAPVPSNFMARVWQDIEAAERHGASARAGWRGWFRWPSLAQQFAVAVVLLGVAVVLSGRRGQSPAQVAQSIEQVTTLASMPSIEMLKDFEIISRLNQSSADLDLLAVLERDR